MIEDSTTNDKIDVGNTPSQNETDKTDTVKPKVQMRYRVEYQDSTTGQILRSEQGNEPTTLQSDSQHPPFEEVKVYKVKSPGSGPGTAPAPTDTKILAYPGAVPPRRLLRIFSPAIINALQSVVRYYPDQDLTGDTVEVHWPYPVLAHHYDELKEFAETCMTKTSDQLCERERDAVSHISALLQYLDDEIMDSVRTERERNKRGFYTFEWYWVGQSPGTTILQTIVEDKNVERLVVYSVSGGIFDYPTSDWKTIYWNINFDGTYLGRSFKNIGPTRKFDGEAPMNSNTFRIVGFGETVNYDGPHSDTLKELVNQGKIYWSLLKKQCRYHSGKARQFPYNKVCTSMLNYLSY